MDSPPIQLHACSHGHLTRDLPMSLARLWGLRLAPLLPLGFLGGVSTGLGSWILALSYVGVLLVVRRVLKRLRYLSGTRGVSRGLESTSEKTGGTRLECFGDPIELEQLGELTTDPFEPVIAPYYSMSRSKIEWIMILAGLIGLIVSSGYLGFGHAISAIVGAVMMLMFSSVFYVSPSFYRVVPGRLDCLSVGFVTGTLRSCSSVSLKEARIVCRYDAQTLEIMWTAGHDGPGSVEQSTRPEPVTTAINLATLLQPHMLCETVFRAAISEAPPPPLPPDAFLG